MKKILVNVDFDGVLVPNILEELFFKKLELDGATTSKIPNEMIDWYIKLVNTSPNLPLNYNLLKFFSNRLDRYTFRLWTNRNDDLKIRTLDNLGPFKSLFDSFQFLNGDKIKTKTEEIVVDNCSKYLHCGESGILYSF